MNEVSLHIFGHISKKNIIQTIPYSFYQYLWEPEPNDLSKSAFLITNNKFILDEP